MSRSEPSPTDHERARHEFLKSTLKNNLKGLGHGIALFSFVSLAEVLFYLFSPTWLSLRTDSGRSQCWRSDGILQSNVHSGNGMGCSQPAHSKPSSFCQLNPDSDLCQATQSAAIFSLCNIVVLVSSVILYFMSKHRRTQDAVILFLFLSSLSVVLGVATLYVMLTSPLFSSDYLSELSVGDDGKSHFGLPFSGLASCSFDTPFAGPLSFFRSAEFRCVFPGPAALVAAVQVLTSLVAFTFSWIYLHLSKRYSEDLASHDSRDTNHSVDFSIFGEFERRLKHRPRIQRFLLATFVPCALAVLQGYTLFSYLLHGISIVTEIVVTVQTSKHSSPHEVYRDELNVFNFSPLTATSFFWRADAQLIAVASIASIVVLPVCKLIVWVYFVFVPSKSIVRSRALFIADTSGKFQLASLYILTLVSIGMMFSRRFSFPYDDESLSIHNTEVHFGHIYPRFTLDIRTAMNPGLGSWMFEITFVSSLLFGQILVSANLAASEWHEKAKRQITGLTSQLEFVEDQVGGDDVLYRAECARRPLLEYYEDDGEEARRKHGVPYTSGRSSPTREASRVEGHIEGNAHHVPYGDAPVPFRFTDQLRGYAVAAKVIDGLDPTRSTLTMQDGVLQGRVSKKPGLASLEDDFLCLVEPSFSPSEALRRTSMAETSITFLSPRRSSLSRRSTMTSIHPHVLALCDRTLYPRKGVRLKFTTKGKLVILSLCLIDGVLLLLCQFMTIFTIHVSELFGWMKGEMQARHSLMSVLLTLGGANGQTQLIDVASLFLITTCIAPTMRLFGMVFLWMVPFTLRGKRNLLHGLEILSAWSALDVILFSLIMMFFGMESATRQLISESIPRMSHLMHLFLPHAISDLSASIHPTKVGFVLLTITVVLDKVVALVIFEQAVASIAERIADETLSEAVIAVEEDVEQLGRAFRLPSEEEIIDAATDILETEAVTYFGPVERYMSALMPNRLYAGFPRSFWTGAAISLGLVNDATVVSAFNDAGEILPSPL